MNAPIHLTAAAIDHIDQIIQRSPQAIGFRLGVKKAGCSGYRYVPEVVDCCLPQEQSYPVSPSVNWQLIVETQWLPVLTGCTVDVKSASLGQRQLIFSNPNGENECGCGESFSLRDQHEED